MQPQLDGALPRRGCPIAIGPGRRLRGAAIFAVLALIPAAASRPSTDDLPLSLEYQIKASFVYTVAKFVDWPASAFPAPGQPMTFGILGDDDVSDAIAEALRGKRVHDRDLVVKRLSDPRAARDCHIVYVSDTESRSLRALLGPLAASGILTVGEETGFAASGGILGLTLRETLVQFEVNMAAAQRAGLTISSKILRLGRVVKDSERNTEGRP